MSKNVCTLMNIVFYCSFQLVESRAPCCGCLYVACTFLFFIRCCLSPWLSGLAGHFSDLEAEVAGSNLSCVWIRGVDVVNEDDANYAKRVHLIQFTWWYRYLCIFKPHCFPIKFNTPFWTQICVLNWVCYIFGWYLMRLQSKTVYTCDMDIG